MPQRLDQRVVNNFIKGLVTEAGELTFPEGASVDELNCTLDRDGSRSRRKGLIVEEGATLSTFTITETQTFHTGEWKNAGGVSGLDFMVVQASGKLFFYRSNIAPYSAQQETYSLTLSTYQSLLGPIASEVKCQFTSISGILVVASEAIDTVFITYDSTTSTFTPQRISFRIRDFDWQSDFTLLTNEIDSPDVTLARKYDTLNSGWVAPNGNTALTTYTGANGGDYPPLTHPWYSGKNSSGVYSQAEWDKVYQGSSIISNGHYILDFFNQDRTTASGIVGISAVTESARFKAVTTYAGRIFYAGLGSGKNSGKVLFSQLLTTVDGSTASTTLGSCYQQNDPTAEDFSDLLETDGGVIVIPEAYNIKKLHTYGPSLYVFAENGVWVIQGVDDKFSPTGFFVGKVSNIGIYNESTFVSADGTPFWWSKYGIHTLGFDEITGKPQDQNISISTIQRFWDAIDTNAKASCVSAYDPINKKVFWSYPSNGETLLNKKNEFLVLDIPLQAFYPWSVTSNTSYTCGLFFFDGYGSELSELDVFDSSLANVTISTSEVVTVIRANTIFDADTQIACLTRDSTTGKMLIHLFNGDTFLDWSTDNYSSFAESGYDFYGDLLLKKTAPYIVVYCRSTEEGFTGSEAVGYNPINPSGLSMSAFWDFKTTPSSTQEVYRIKPMPIVNPLDLTDTGLDRTVLTSRMKVRGSGRNMRLRFESVPSKNFILLGYGVLSGANQRF